MAGIKVTHIHKSPHRRGRENCKVESSRSRVHVADLENTIPKRYLKELKGRVRISGGAQKTVWQGAVYVGE